MRVMVTLLCLFLLLAPSAHARSVDARIARMETSLATLEQVRMRLDWPQGADRGDLHLQVGRLDAPDVDLHYRELDWRCQLQRDKAGGWQCDGPLRGGRAPAMRLALDLGVASTDVLLAQGSAHVRVQRSAATPDLTTLDLKAVPLLWAQALLRQAWKEGALAAGKVDGRLLLQAPAAAPMQMRGDFDVQGLALHNADSSVAAEAVNGHFDVEYDSDPSNARLRVAGRLRSGQFLAGSTFVDLPQGGAGVLLEGRRAGENGWQFPVLQWRDGHVLTADGSLAFGADGAIRHLQLVAHSDDIAPMRDRYLSGQLALTGMGGVALQGGFDLRLQADAAGLEALDLSLHQVSIDDPGGRLALHGLDGRFRHLATGQVDSDLRWSNGALAGLAFEAARFPLRSRDGELQLRAPVVIPVLGGVVKLDGARLRPPRGEDGLDIRFGLELGGIDVGKLSAALGLPAFQGTLGGFIPQAHYSGDSLTFDGGLSMSLFDGSVQFSSLVLERPFGSAPSLSADIALNDVDLMQLTGVLDVGSISGRLDGTVEGLRLVNWSPVAFDASLSTNAEAARRHKVKQRISQRAVQDISSVGDASFVTSLQGQLIGMFSDFGYSRIGIGCRLEREVCRMSGLDAHGSDSGSGSSGAGFTIVRGAGLPRLDVVGFNRDVDWPTLLERITAASSGEVAPRVE